MKHLLWLSLLLCGAALANPRQNNLIVGTSQEPPNLQDYWTNVIGISSEINGYVWTPLLVKNDAGQLLAGLAERVPTFANGDYQLTRQGGTVVSNSVTYHIRKDATWSDGTPITAGDVAFWLEVQNDPGVPVPQRDPWNNATLRRLDDKTFTLTFKPPSLFADQVPPGYAPAHVMRADWNAYKAATAKLDPKTQGQDINDRWGRFIAAFTTSGHLPPVSAGPFQVTAWRPGASVTLARNPRYWRKPPGDEKSYVQQVIYRFITDTNTLRVNVLSGQVDALSPIGVTFDQALELQKAERGRFKTFFVPGSNWEHIDLNKFADVQSVKDLNLDDPRVRQALLYAMNREALVQALFNGRQPVSHSFVNTLSPLYKQDIQRYGHDPDKARQLFAAAGWTPGADGILTKNGRKFSLRFTTTAGNKVRERVQQVIAQQWRAVGVDTQIANQPAAVALSQTFAQRASEGKWDLLMFFWGQDPALESGALFASELPSGASNIPTRQNGYSGQNIGGWKNAAYDDLFRQASAEFDPARRGQLFDRMQAIWAEELPALPLYNRANPYTRATGLANFTFTASSLYPSWAAHLIGWTQNGAREVKAPR